MTNEMLRNYKEMQIARRILIITHSDIDTPLNAKYELRRAINAVVKASDIMREEMENAQN